MNKDIKSFALFLAAVYGLAFPTLAMLVMAGWSAVRLGEYLVDSSAHTVEKMIEPMILAGPVCGMVATVGIITMIVVASIKVKP